MIVLGPRTIATMGTSSRRTQQAFEAGPSLRSHCATRPQIDIEHIDVAEVQSPYAIRQGVLTVLAWDLVLDDLSL